MEYHRQWKERQQRINSRSVVQVEAKKIEEQRQRIKEEQENKKQEEIELQKLRERITRQRDYIYVASNHDDVIKSEEDKRFWRLSSTYMPSIYVMPENIRRICAEVCIKHNVKWIDIISDRRFRPIMLPRFEVMYRLRTETTYSLPRIGKILGGRDHTTILHGYERFKYMIENQEVIL